MIATHDEELEQAARAFLRLAQRARANASARRRMPLVRRMAMSILRRLPAHFTPDDLIGDGCVGLLRAINRFDPERGMRFEVWAARLVRGAILNGLRTMDLIPERVRRDARSLDRARWRLAQHQGTAPTDSAAAARAGLNARKLNAVLLALRRAVPASLDAPPPQAFDQTSVLGDRTGFPDRRPWPNDRGSSDRRCGCQAVQSLGTRERLIIASFYSGGRHFAPSVGGWASASSASRRSTDGRLRACARSPGRSAPRRVTVRAHGTAPITAPVPPARARPSAELRTVWGVVLGGSLSGDVIIASPEALAIVKAGMFVRALCSRESKR